MPTVTEKKPEPTRSLLTKGAHDLALAIFAWIESWYNPKRRHSYCKMLSPVEHEAASAA